MALWRHNNPAGWERIPLRGTHRDLSAVIVGGGPSLNSIDVNSLRGPGRVVIGMNSTYPLLRPDYWLGMDDAGCYDGNLWHEPFPKILRGVFGNEMHAERQLRDLSQTWFADVEEEPAGDGFRWYRDTLRIAVQFAQWLGCREFVFAGVDLDNSARDYADERVLTHEQRDYNQRLYQEQFAWLERFAWRAPCVTVCDTRLRGIMHSKPLAAALDSFTSRIAPSPTPRPHVLAPKP